MTETIPTSEVLNRAADLIQKRGWGTGAGSWGGCAGPICIDEALARAYGFSGCNMPDDGGIWPDALGETPAVVAMRAYLGARANGGHDLYVWNDAKDRTDAEVIEVLRACAVIEASREREGAEVSA